jgi:hypothetical protein
VVVVDAGSVAGGRRSKTDLSGIGGVRTKRLDGTGYAEPEGVRVDKGCGEGFQENEGQGPCDSADEAVPVGRVTWACT